MALSTPPPLQHLFPLLQLCLLLARHLHQPTTCITLRERTPASAARDQQLVEQLHAAAHSRSKLRAGLLGVGKGCRCEPGQRGRDRAPLHSWVLVNHGPRPQLQQQVCSRRGHRGGRGRGGTGGEVVAWAALWCGQGAPAKGGRATAAGHMHAEEPASSAHAHAGIIQPRASSSLRRHHPAQGIIQPRASSSPRHHPAHAGIISPTQASSSPGHHPAQGIIQPTQASSSPRHHLAHAGIIQPVQASSSSRHHLAHAGIIQPTQASSSPRHHPARGSMHRHWPAAPHRGGCKARTQASA